MSEGELSHGSAPALLLAKSLQHRVSSRIQVFILRITISCSRLRAASRRAWEIGLGRTRRLRSLGGCNSPRAVGEQLELAVIAVLHGRSETAIVPFCEFAVRRDIPMQLGSRPKAPV
jgi:hypothetical protein